MTLEERVEALENAIASMAAQHLTGDQMSETVRKAASEAAASARRPGGVSNAVQKQTAHKMIITNNEVKIVDKSGAIRVSLGPLW